MNIYGTSPIRRRRSREELGRLDAALTDIAYEVAPATVRQIFYQAVVRGLVPKSETTGYRVVQRRLLKLREDETIPYGLITDNARMVRTRARWGSPEHFAREAAARYRRDYWADSEVRVEVWLEKDALAGVLSPTVVDECGLDLYVTRGFASVTYLQEAAEFVRDDGRPTFVYVLTDFDPSGLSIAEIVERELVARSWPTEVAVERLAVHREQIDIYGLPTRPTKTTDARARKFEREHGTGSVELDAIPPDVLRGLVKASVERHMDDRKLSLLKLAERREREGLRSLFGGAS